METMRYPRFTAAFGDVIEINDEPNEQRGTKTIWGAPNRETESDNPRGDSMGDACDSPVLLFDSNGWCFRDSDDALQLEAEEPPPSMRSVLVRPAISI